MAKSTYEGTGGFMLMNTGEPVSMLQQRSYDTVAYWIGDAIPSTLWKARLQ